MGKWILLKKKKATKILCGNVTPQKQKQKTFVENSPILPHPTHGSAQGREEAAGRSRKLGGQQRSSVSTSLVNRLHLREGEKSRSMLVLLLTCLRKLDQIKMI
jgi:hypothetical protein